MIKLFPFIILGCSLFSIVYLQLNNDNLSQYTEEEIKITKTNQNIGKLDIALIVDNTGSMGGEINVVKKQILDIINKISKSPLAQQKEIQYSIIAYRDYEDSWVTKFQDFTTDLDIIKKACSIMVADGGGDTPEAASEGFEKALKANWREDSEKIAIWIADAPPHPSTHQKAKPYMPLIEDLKELGAKIHCICVRFDSQTSSIMKKIAQSTRGMYVSLENSDTLADIIVGTAENGLELQRFSTLIHKIIQENVNFLQDSVKHDELRVKWITLFSNKLNQRVRQFILQDKQVKYIFKTSSARDIKEAITYLNSKKQLSPCLNYQLFCSLQRDIIPEIGLISKRTQQRLELKNIKYNINTYNQIAEVQIEQEYFNNSEKDDEVEYVFPIMENSAITGFKAQIKDVLVNAEIKENEEAKRIYNQARQRGETAYLLDQQISNIFKMSICNIPPQTKAIITITYIQQLEISDDQKQLKYIMPITLQPKYDIESSNSENWIDDILNNKIEKIGVSLDMTITSDNIIKNIESSLADKLNFELNWDKKKANIQSKDFNIFEDIVITSNFEKEFKFPGLVQKISNPQKEAESTENFDISALLQFTPLLEQLEKSKLENVKIVFDTSSSMMKGQVSQKLRKVLIALLNELKELNTINSLSVYQFSSEMDILSENKNLKDDKKFDELKKSIDNLFDKKSKPLGGGSNILEPYNYITKANKKCDIFLITDGMLSNMNNLLFDIYSNNKNQNNLVTIHPIGLGYSIDYLNLKQLAQFSNTLPTFIQINYSDEVIIHSLKKLIERSQFKNYKLQLNIEGIKDPENSIITSPKHIPTIINGKPLYIYLYGKALTQQDWDNLKVTLEIKDLNEKTISVYPVQISDGQLLNQNNFLNSFVTRQLIKEYENIEQICDSSKFKTDIITLSLKNNIASKYTSFVAVMNNTKEQKQEEKENQEQQNIKEKEEEEIEDEMDDSEDGGSFAMSFGSSSKRSYAKKESSYASSAHSEEKNAEEEAEVGIMYDSIAEADDDKSLETFGKRIAFNFILFFFIIFLCLTQFF